MISLLLSFLYFLITYFVKSRKFAKSHGAKSPKVLRHWDLFLGLDCVVYTARVTAKKLTFSDIQTNFREIGSAYVTRVLGDDFLFTDDPKNAQAILITQFPNFNMGGRRRQDTSKLLGHGIFNADGAYWEHSRALIRPDFIKKQVADLAINEEHAQHMMRQFPTDGKSVDLQSFFFHLTLNTATDFMFGKLIDSLHPNASEGAQRFSWAFDYALRTIAQKLRLGPLTQLYAGRLTIQSIRSEPLAIARIIKIFPKEEISCTTK